MGNLISRSPPIVRTRSGSQSSVTSAGSQENSQREPEQRKPVVAKKTLTDDRPKNSRDKNRTNANGSNKASNKRVKEAHKLKQTTIDSTTGKIAAEDRKKR